MNKIVRGSGGMFGGGKTVTNSPDTLRSEDTVEFTLGICEGPIAGLADGPKTFYLGDTPLISQNDENNFDSFELHLYHGDADASKLKNALGGIGSNNPVGVQLAELTPVTRQTPAELANQIDALEVRLNFSQLFRVDGNGAQRETEAQFKLEFKKTSDTEWSNFFSSSKPHKVELVRTFETIEGRDSYTQTNEAITEIPWKGNLEKQDPTSATGFSVPGAVTDTSQEGYNRRKDGSYGSLYYHAGNGDYKFVVDTAAAEALTDKAYDNFPLVPSNTVSNVRNGTWKLKVEVRNGHIVYVKGKTTSTYVKEYVRRVDRTPEDWEIRLTKISSDTDDKLYVTMTWESFQCVTRKDKAYDNLAVIRGLGVGSNQFSNIPQFNGVYHGKLVMIPSNYDPVTRHYSGVWDGTFKLGYTDNPVWCLYDLLTNTTYGVKAYYPELLVDRFSFYDAAQWCDGLVPREAGGYQPRYTYNDYIQQHRPGLEQCQYIAALFGGVLTEDLNGTVVLKVDKPAPMVQIFGAESTTVEEFNYSKTDITTRANDIEVTFINPDLNWVEDVRRIYDQGLIDKNGRIPLRLITVGCIDVHEAQRRAQLRLISANTEVTTVTFSTARQGVLLEPMDVIGIADPYMKWGASGRIASVKGDQFWNLTREAFDAATLRADVSAATWKAYSFELETGAAPTYDTTGLTTGLSFLMPSYQDATTPMRVLIQAKKGTGDNLHAAFSSNQNGNSGLQTFALTDELVWYEFEYNMPASTTNDYLGVWGDANTTIEIADIKIEYVDPTIMLRDRIYLNQNVDLTCDIQTPSGIHTLTVQNQTGSMYADRLAITAGSLPADLPDRAQFTLSSTLDLGLVKPFRIMTIAEDDTESDRFTITAIEVNVNKHDDADNMTSTGMQDYAFSKSQRPSAPTNLNAASGTDHLFINADGNVRSRIHLTWEQDPYSFAEEFIVMYRRLDRENFKRITANGNDVYLENVQDGHTYEIYIQAVNAIGRKSPKSERLRHIVVGKTQRPSDVTQAYAVQNGPDVNIGITPVSDLDLDYYLIKLDGNRIGSTEDGSFVHRNVEGTVLNYEIQAVDTSNKKSATPFTITHNIPTPSTPGASYRFVGDQIEFSVTPPSAQNVPIKEYLIESSGEEVYRGAALKFQMKAEWSGAKTFTVKSVNSAGQESPPVTLNATINPPDAVTLMGSVTETGAFRLTWNQPSSTLPITHYVLRNATEGVIEDGGLKATNFTGNITWLADRTFEVWAVDSAGNTGPAGSFLIDIVEPSISTLSATVSKAEMRLTWTGVKGSMPIKEYHVYDGAALLGTLNAQIYTLTVDWNGAKTFNVYAEDILGNLSTVATHVETIDAPGEPQVSISIKDQNVQLTWDEPASELSIVEYRIYKGGSSLQKLAGTSILLPVDWLGSMEFGVAAIDTAGNEGTASLVSQEILAPSSFVLSHSFEGDQVRFSWTTPTSDLPIKEYIVERAGTEIARVTANSFTLKPNWADVVNFTVTAIDTSGNTSPAASTSVVITPPSAPSVTSEVLDNNILFRWSNGSGTLPVATTEFRKGATFAAAEVLHQSDSTFAAFFEFESGTFDYWAVNVDSAGNYGQEVKITVSVTEPPDFLLQANLDSDLSGARTNVVFEEGMLFFGLDESETFAQHFTNNSFTSPQDQVDAGYPLFMQPVDPGTASYYDEDIDYGTVIASSIITVTPTVLALAGDGAIQIEVWHRELATDTWTKVVGQNRVYAQNFRYVKVRLKLNADTADDLVRVSALNIRLNTKIRNDAGNGTAAAGDTGGTAVTFNVDFIDIQSIVVTPKSTSPVIAIYDFTDVPNPTGFSVYLFDKDGVRISGDFSWTVRGF